ncbi:MAG: DUF2100 domain-containing protein [Promethearchaeota archaeon]
MLSVIDDLIEIKHLIRKTVPNYDLKGNLQNEFYRIIKTLYFKLQPIFSNYLKIEEFEESLTSRKNLKEKIINYLKNNIALISANSYKKKLKNIGINPQNLIVTGGPLFLDDYKTINPNLPENTLHNLKKKIERIIFQLKSEDWTNKELFFIFDPQNITDKLILAKLEDLSFLIGKNIKTIEIKSWKDLEI